MWALWLRGEMLLMLSDCVSCFLSSGKRWGGLCLPCAHMCCLFFNTHMYCFKPIYRYQKNIIFSCHLYWNDSEFCLRCLLQNLEWSVSQQEGRVWSCWLQVPSMTSCFSQLVKGCLSTCFSSCIVKQGLLSIVSETGRTKAKYYFLLLMALNFWYSKTFLKT